MFKSTKRQTQRAKPFQFDFENNEFHDYGDWVGSRKNLNIIRRAKFGKSEAFNTLNAGFCIVSDGDGMPGMAVWQQLTAPGNNVTVRAIEPWINFAVNGRDILLKYRNKGGAPTSFQYMQFNVPGWSDITAMFENFRVKAVEVSIDQLSTTTEANPMNTDDWVPMGYGEPAFQFLIKKSTKWDNAMSIIDILQTDHVMWNTNAHRTVEFTIQNPVIQLPMNNSQIVDSWQNYQESTTAISPWCRTALTDGQVDRPVIHGFTMVWNHFGTRSPMMDDWDPATGLTQESIISYLNFSFGVHYELRQQL